MYIERKQRGDSFWIVHFENEKDKEEYIEYISYAISDSIDEEHKEFFETSIVEPLKKAQHSEKYDKGDEQTVIISTSQIASILEYFFILTYMCGYKYEYINEKLEQIINETDEVIEETNNFLEQNAQNP